MKNLTIKSLFVGLFVAASLALTACGGGTGDSGSSSSDVNPGDGVVTQAEAASIKAGMNKDQVIAIMGTPTRDENAALQWPGEQYNGHETSYQVVFQNGVPTWLSWFDRTKNITLSVTKIPE